MKNFLLYIFFFLYLFFSKNLLSFDNIYETEFYNVEINNEIINDSKIREINKIKRLSFHNILKKILSRNEYNKLKQIIQLEVEIEYLIKSILINDEFISSNKYSSAYDARCIMSIVSTNSSSSNTSGYNHNTVFKYGSTIVLDTLYSDYQLISHEFNIPISQIGSSTTAINHSISNIGQGTDYQKVSHITLLYPHTQCLVSGR